MIPSRRPGTTIPPRTAMFVRRAESRGPRSATTVISQIVTTITVNRNTLFDPRSGSTMYEALTVITDMIAGIAITPANHWSHTVMNPKRSPNATAAHA
jgi:hypothetical protein